MTCAPSGRRSPNSPPISASTGSRTYNLNGRMDLLITNDKLVNYLLSQWKPIAQGSACSSQELVPVRLHDLLRFTNRRAQNDSRCAGLAVSGTGELDRYHKGAYKSLREEASKAS